MFLSKNKYSFLYFIFIFIFTNGFSQIYNSEIEAKINIETNNEFIKVTGSAFNKTKITQSLRYVFSVIRTNAEDSNQSKNDQSGRVILSANEKNNLSTTTINVNSDDRIILLLLIYNTEESIVGKDRIVINDTKETSLIKEELKEKLEASVPTKDMDNTASDGVVLRGIVIEETKTKPGRDFYNIFYSAYLTNNINGDKIVTIKESLALGTNTKIQVKIEEDVVLEFFLRPQNDFLKSMSDVSIQNVYNYFQRLQQDSKIIKRF